MGQEACAYRWPGDGGGKQGWWSLLHNRRRIFCPILVNEGFLLKVTTSPACRSSLLVVGMPLPKKPTT